jgi:histidinol-phosphatase
MPGPPVSESLLEFAVDLTRRAGDLTLQWFRAADLAVDRKSDGTPVTEADRTCERRIREELARERPGDAVIGEEEGAQAGTTDVRWYVDPLDGTKAFTRGVPLYSTLLAASDAHGPAIGVIHLPALGETIYAGRGRGCFCNGRPARVSAVETLRDACLTTSGFDYWPDPALAAVKASGMAMRTWGDAYGYALVATGRAEVMVDPVAAVWDVAPMLVILPEAGGRFTDLSGAARADGGSGVASNGRLHETVLPMLNAPIR